MYIYKAQASIENSNLIDHVWYNWSMKQRQAVSNIKKLKNNPKMLQNSLNNDDNSQQGGMLEHAVDNHEDAIENQQVDMILYDMI